MLVVGMLDPFYPRICGEFDVLGVTKWQKRRSAQTTGCPGDHDEVLSRMGKW